MNSRFLPTNFPRWAKLLFPIRRPVDKPWSNDHRSPEAVDWELALLLVHGVLHLVGHDHGEPAETEEMQQKERAALAAVPHVGNSGIRPL